MIQKVTIDLTRGTNNEYMIKDSSGITIGRFTILDMQKDNKNCALRLKFYRNDRELLKSTIIAMCKKIFNVNEIFKLNIIVDEDTDMFPFVETGFVLEGILEDNIYYNNSYKSEFIFGLNAMDYTNLTRIIPFLIKGRRIDLKVLTPELSEEHLDYYIRNKKHLEYYEPMRDESFYSIEVQKKILSENYKQYLNGISINLGIFIDKTLIGKIQISNIVQGIFKSAFIGYSIDKDYQGKGYMKEAVNLVCDYAFNELDLHRLEASTLIDNERSQNVLKSCGFNELGINKAYLYINGAWRDHVTFYKIR